MKKLKIVCISDTHRKHYELAVPDGDILIHAGDISGRGSENEVRDFLDWYHNLPHKHKVLIAGNHDFIFEKLPEYIENVIKKEYPSITYLNDTNVVIEGLKIHGSPIQPWFLNWAFNRQRGADIKKHWNLIPADTDILVVHGPPYKLGDLLLPRHQKQGEDPNVGCKDLRAKIEEVKPKFVIAGHIHESYGVYYTEDTTYINASVLNADYELVNEPIIVEL